MKQNSVKSPQFSFRLAPSGGVSELFLGGANSKHYTGSMEWVDVTSKSYWTVEGSVNINSTAAIKDAFMIVDTGMPSLCDQDKQSSDTCA